MPSFSQASLEKLFDVHVDLRTLFLEVVKHVDCTVLCGYRDREAQTKAFAEGNSKLRWPDSKHNAKPSSAVDVAIYPIDWNDKDRFIWFGGLVQGTAMQLKAEYKISHDIRYGGAWKGLGQLNKSGLNDLVHFELIKL